MSSDPNPTNPTAVIQHAEHSASVLDARSVQDVLHQAKLIQEIMRSVMKDGEHYGTIPGTEKRDRNGALLPPEQQKKTLFKSGAEKLCFVFRLAPKAEIFATDLPNGHREYRIVTNLYDRGGNFLGQGVGLATTMESKYRYRGASGKPCPSCGELAAKPSKKEFGGGYYCDAKAGGGCGWKAKAGTIEAKALDEITTVKSENPDPADVYNTILKMASKRSLVDATLKATAASDIFSQDLEDLEDQIGDELARNPVAAPQMARTAAAPPQAQASSAPAAATTQGQPTGGTPPPAAATANKHPAFAASKLLMDALDKEKPDAGRAVLIRICQLHGASAPKNLVKDKLDAFGDDIAELTGLNLAQVEDKMAIWEQSAREAAAEQQGGGK